MTARRRKLLAVVVAVVLLACNVHVSVSVAGLPVLVLAIGVVLAAELAFLALIGVAILRALTGWSVRAG